MKGKPALADVGQMVDIIDNRQRAGSKGVALFLKTQGLLAHLLQQSGQSAPGFLLASRRSFQLGSNGFHFGDGPGRIAVPGTRLQVDLDHNQSGDDREDSQKQRRRGADPVLRLRLLRA